VSYRLINNAVVNKNKVAK